MNTLRTCMLLAGLAALAGAAAAGDSELNPAPTAKDWAAIARLPDWSAGRSGGWWRCWAASP